MVKLTFPDGQVREYSAGIQVIEVAKSISEGLARNVISASFNDTTIETTTTLSTDGTLKFYTWNDKEGKKSVLAFEFTCHGTSIRRIVCWHQIDYWSCY